MWYLENSYVYDNKAKVACVRTSKDWRPEYNEDEGKSSFFCMVKIYTRQFYAAILKRILVKVIYLKLKPICPFTLGISIEELKVQVNLKKNSSTHLQSNIGKLRASPRVSGRMVPEYLKAREIRGCSSAMKPVVACFLRVNAREKIVQC